MHETPAGFFVVFAALFLHLIGCTQQEPPATPVRQEVIDAAPIAIASAESRLLEFDAELRRGNASAAELQLRTMIDEHPNDVRGYRSLAQLLNAEGRRSETINVLLDVERLSGMSQLEALSLIDVGGPFRLIDFGDLIKVESPSSYDLCNARFIFGKGERHAQTLAALAPLKGTIFESLAIQAFTGRVIAESGDESALNAWLQGVAPGIEDYPEYWLAFGIWLQRNHRLTEAARAYGETLRRDPTERRTLRLLADVIDQLGGKETSVQARKTLATLDRIVLLVKDANGEESRWIGEQLNELLRPLEAIAWLRHSLVKLGPGIDSFSELSRRREEVLLWESTAPEGSIPRARLHRMLGFDIEAFPIPDLSVTVDSVKVANAAHDSSEHQIKFVDVAGELGVSTQFVSDYPKSGRDFLLYQANGGGIAVLDYDRDGYVDLYFVQSGGDPRQQNSSEPNELFRSLAASHFVDVSTRSHTDDRSYGQGVCAADVNQDGFDDLVIANIGPNSLYINQGDGTFSPGHELINSAVPAWTMSIAVADLNGDHLPDLVEVNYVDDPAVFTSVCGPRHTDCTPSKFKAAADRFVIADGTGRFTDWSPSNGPTPPSSYGMGVVVANFDGQNGNDVFVSNDGDFNHYWKSQSRDAASNDNLYHLLECGAISGCAVGGNGYPQACMGIASADFDGNGFLDLFVTNFHDEPVNLFQQNPSGNFSDQAQRAGLADKTMDVLGFGAQAADFDNDGRPDIANLNGHLYDASEDGVAFRMVPHLFHGCDTGFNRLEPATLGAFWSQPQLGRTLVQTDYDRDGRVDLISNSLLDPVAVLHNQSVLNNWIELELVGVTSERAATGVKLSIRTGSSSYTAWQIAGDGYMGTSDPNIHLGLGVCAIVDEITVQWPSGLVVSFDKVEANHHYQIIENQPELFSLRVPQTRN